VKVFEVELAIWEANRAPPGGQGGKTAWGHVNLPRALQPDRSIGIDRQFHDGRVRQGGIELPEIGVEIAHQ
jgi:hypothetical protein